MSLKFANEQPDWNQEVTFTPEDFGLQLDPNGQGREFYRVDTMDALRSGFTRTYLRNSLITVGTDDQGNTTLTMALSYFIAKGLPGLMTQEGADAFFTRDGSQDLRHHQEDNATALGLQAGQLTNSNLAQALAGDFMPDPVDDDDDFVDDDDTVDATSPIQDDDVSAILGSVLDDDDTLKN